MKLTKVRILLINCLVITSLLISGTAYAQDDELPEPGITPDSPIYFIDNFGKQVGMFFAFGSEAKVKKALEYAGERLAEAQVMATKNKSDKVQQAAGGYGEFMATVSKKMEEAGQAGLSDNISELVAIAASKHLSVLDRVKDKVPEQAKGAISHAREVSVIGQ